MEGEIEKKARAAFRTIPGVGSQRLRQLIAYFGSATDAWQAASGQYSIWSGASWVTEVLKRRESIDLDKIAEKLIQAGIHTVMPGEEQYPYLLGELADAPPLLYFRGYLCAKSEALAIVGSRRATAYGKAAANYLAKEGVKKGLVIVSGLARGIDTAAHEGALAGQGITWAFLGCGLDQVYPKENRHLADRIIENKGALISEFIPGTPPLATHFPARNRLISGCARGVVVAEAAQKSGALITVDFALEQGREVFAVPGPIFSEMSKGTHQLLRQGAKIVEGIEDICAEVPSWSGDLCYSEESEEKAGMSEEKAGQALTNHTACSLEQQEILSLLSDVPLHIDKIVLQCTVSASQVALALLQLQLAGSVKQLPGQHYIINRDNP